MAYMAHVATVLSLRMDNIIQMLTNSSDIDELYVKIFNMKKTLQDACSIARVFNDNTINDEKVRELTMFLSLALRKIKINDMEGLNWCLHKTIQTI